MGSLRSEVASRKAREEEFKAKAKDDELKIKELEEKVAQYESGSTVNQNIIDAVMSQFFSSDEWLRAQIDNVITSGNKTISPTLSVFFYIFLTSIFTNIFHILFSSGC